MLSVKHGRLNKLELSLIVMSIHTQCVVKGNKDIGVYKNFEKGA